MTLFRRKLLLPIGALLFLACHQQNTETRIKVSAKRLDGSPVALAKVEIDGSSVGETNAFGTFSDLIYLSSDSEHYVSVSLDDNTYYYSPHTTKFSVLQGGTNDIDVQATMYLAPKPKKHGAVNSSSVDTSIAKESSSGDLSDIPNDDRFNLPLLPVTAADFTAKSSAEMLNVQDRAKIMFTAHVFNGHTPLPGATVTWSEPSSFEHRCTTNDRGRCVIQASANSQSPGSLLVRKSGFESLTQQFLAADNQNVRLKLSPGTSLDLQVFSASLRNDVPYNSVKIYEGNKHLATSDGSGYAIIPLVGKRRIDLKFVSPTQIKPIAAGEFAEFGEILKIRLADRKPEKAVYKISDVHVFKNHDIKLGPELIESVIASLLDETAGIRTRSIELSSEASDNEYIGIIPILENSYKGLTLTLTAFEPSEGLVISEQIAEIPHSKSALSDAVSTLLARIKKRHSTSGLIERVDGSQIYISIDNNGIEVGDNLNIADHESSLKATVLNTQKDKLIAKLPVTIEAQNIWRFLGKKATRPARDSSKISSLVNLLPKIIAKTPQSEAIDIAKKHRIENNPKQALKALDITKVEDIPTRILMLQERADNHLALDQKGLALASLYEALPLALAQANEAVMSTISININRLRSEILPVLKEDEKLLETLKELELDNSRLMADLAKWKADSVVVATLRYTTLLTKQKLAETSLDVASMTTLEHAWETFAKDLENTEDKERAAELNRAVTTARKPFRLKPDDRSVKL